MAGICWSSSHKHPASCPARLSHLSAAAKGGSLEHNLAQALQEVGQVKKESWQQRCLDQRYCANKRCLWSSHNDNSGWCLGWRPGRW